MEVIWLSALTQDWWVPAVCDLVALSAMVGITLVLARTNRPAPARLEARPVTVTPTLSDLLRETPTHTPAEPAAPARTDVKRALAAINQWETSYRSGRGVAELARFVQTQSSLKERTR